MSASARVPSFWDKLPRPFLCLAPMSNVTDSATRLILARHAKPDVIFTEFVSIAGLCSKKGRPRLLPDLRFDPCERPVVAQFFGREPEQFHTCAALAAELGFDGIDINLGCPDKSVLKQGSGAGLIREPALVAEIVQAAKEGGKGLPVSVKTRTGYSHEIVDEWIPTLAAMRPAAISLHGRTRRQRYQGFADWGLITKAARIVQAAGIPFVGNGDVMSYREAMDRVQQSGADGVMIGRATIGNPWVFSAVKERKTLSQQELFDVIIEHAKLYEEHYTGIKSFANVRKHLKDYVADFYGAKALRIALVHTNNAHEVRQALNSFLQNLQS
jgi:nifR3 family TIM-barrel protein